MHLLGGHSDECMYKACTALQYSVPVPGSTYQSMTALLAGHTPSELQARQSHGGLRRVVAGSAGAGAGASFVWWSAWGFSW